MCNFGDIFVCDINLGFGLPRSLIPHIQAVKTVVVVGLRLDGPCLMLGILDLRKKSKSVL